MEPTNKRLEYLLEWTNQLTKNVPEDFLTVMYLYFDGFERGDEKMEVILQCESEIETNM